MYNFLEERMVDLPVDHADVDDALLPIPQAGMDLSGGGAEVRDILVRWVEENRIAMYNMSECMWTCALLEIACTLMRHDVPMLLGILKVFPTIKLMTSF
jgi:hypothetical protein